MSKHSIVIAEAAQKFSLKMVYWNFSQNSQEEPYHGVLFLVMIKSCIFIKKDVVVFLWTLEIFQNNYSIKQLFLKSCLVNNTRCLKYIWPFHPFYNIIHERGKNKMTNMNANKLVMLPKTSSDFFISWIQSSFIYNLKCDFFRQLVF